MSLPYGHDRCTTDVRHLRCVGMQRSAIVFADITLYKIIMGRVRHMHLPTFSSPSARKPGSTWCDVPSTWFYYRVLGATYRVLGNKTKYSGSRTEYLVSLGGTTEYLVIRTVLLRVKTTSLGEILIVQRKIEPLLGITWSRNLPSGGSKRSFPVSCWYGTIGTVSCQTCLP